MSQVVQTPEQQFYLAKLLGFDYDIQYKAGSSNIVADSLSQIDCLSQAQCLILSIPHHEFMTQLKETFKASPEFQQQRAAVLAHPEQYRDFAISGDLILF